MLTKDQRNQLNRLVRAVDDVLGTAAAEDLATGHSNAGALSAARGFFPASPLPGALPPSFAAWDDLAAALPRLVSTLQVRDAVRSLPPLDAHALPALSLRRAAVVLGISAHAFRQVIVDGEPALPATIEVPWRVVCRRLGRAGPLLTYDDLIVYNWRPRAPQADRCDPHALDLLVPAVDTVEERLFYLTQTAITARLGPTLGDALQVFRALAAADVEVAERSLLALAERVREVTRTSLDGLTTAAHAKHRLDPVIWAKTVAPLAVATGNDAPGPSGTSNPALHLLDELVGRTAFRSQLGTESLALREVMPARWRTVLSLLHGRADLGALVAATGRASLQAAFRVLLDAYTGPQGFLARHRSKVYGFVEVAFKVGRSVTIGGFSGPFADRTWDEVDDALQASLAERPAPPLDPSTPKAPRPSLPIRSRSWFYREVIARGARLVDAGGRVLDVARLTRAHPGGPQILDLYVGRQAAAALRRVGHDQSAGIQRWIDKMACAQLADPAPELAPLCEAIERILEVRAAFRLEHAMLDKPVTAAETDEGGATPFRRWHATHAVARLRASFLRWALHDGLIGAWRRRWPANSAWSVLGPALDSLDEAMRSLVEQRLPTERRIRHAHQVLDTVMTRSVELAADQLAAWETGAEIGVSCTIELAGSALEASRRLRRWPLFEDEVVEMQAQLPVEA